MLVIWEPAVAIVGLLRRRRSVEPQTGAPQGRREGVQRPQDEELWSLRSGAPRECYLRVASFVETRPPVPLSDGW